jgi:gamma-glutamyltranspeptidase/glutathione hydrolase
MRIRRIPHFLAGLLSVCVIVAPCRADESVRGVHELVIAGHPLSTQAGLKVLHDGGNAADALIAVSLSLGVTEPGNSGLGGKMVLLYYDAKTKTVSSIVAMSAGCLHVTADQLKALPPEKREKGWTSICTPGIASALGEIHKHWATRPWADLCQPAIRMANDGVIIIPTAAAMFKDFQPHVDAEADRLYAPDGKTLAVGTLFKNPDLGHTLTILAARGPQAFYEGEIADKLVAASTKGGGYLALDDLKNYHARFLEPLKGSFGNFTVYSSPPPLEGGATVLTALACMDRMDWTGAQPRNAKYIDTFSRVLQQVYPEVGRSAGDAPDSLARVAGLLSAASVDQSVALAKAADPRQPYGAKHAVGSAAEDRGLRIEDRGSRIADGQVAGDAQSSILNSLSSILYPPSSYAEALGDESEKASTTHLVIIDKMGNIACCTQSLGLHFGSAVVAPGTGVLFNADVSNFSFGSPKGVNYFVPGKFPRSTMSPTLFCESDKPRLVIGSPAGARIPNLVLQVSLDVLKFNVPLKSAIEAPRFHIIAGSSDADSANHIDFEPAMPAGLETSLDKLGWKANRRMIQDFYFGSVNAALIDNGLITGVADQRRTSDAGGD